MYRLKEILPVDDFLLLNGEFNSAYNNWSFKKNDGGYGHPPRGCLRKPPAKIDTLEIIHYSLSMDLTSNINVRRF